MTRAAALAVLPIGLLLAACNDAPRAATPHADAALDDVGGPEDVGGPGDVGGPEDVGDSPDAGDLDVAPPDVGLGWADAGRADDALPCQPDPCAAVDLGTCERAWCDAETGGCGRSLAADGSGCDDGDPATRGDRCVGGVCLGAADLPVAVGVAQRQGGRLFALQRRAEGGMGVRNTGLDVPSGQLLRLGHQLVVLGPGVTVLDAEAGTSRSAPFSEGVPRLSPWATVPGRRSIVGIAKGEEGPRFVRIDLDPPALTDLGALGSAGPGRAGWYSWVSSADVDGHWAVTIDEPAGAEDGGFELIALRVDGPNAGARRVVARGTGGGAVGVVLLPGALALLYGVAAYAGAGPCTLVDLTGARDPVDVPGCQVSQDYYDDYVVTPALVAHPDGTFLALGGVPGADEPPVLLDVAGPWPPRRWGLPGPAVSLLFVPERGSLLLLATDGAVTEVPVGPAGPGEPVALGYVRGEPSEAEDLPIVGVALEPEAVVIAEPGGGLVMVPFDGGSPRPVKPAGARFHSLTGDGRAAWFTVPRMAPAAAAVVHVPLADPDAATALSVPPGPDGGPWGETADLYAVPGPPELGLVVAPCAPEARLVRASGSGVEHLLAGITDPDTVRASQEGGLVVAEQGVGRWAAVDTSAADVEPLRFLELQRGSVRSLRLGPAAARAYFWRVVPDGRFEAWALSTARLDGGDLPEGHPISVERFDRPSSIRYRLSPDGQWVAFGDPINGWSRLRAAPGDGSWEGTSILLPRPTPAGAHVSGNQDALGFTPEGVLWGYAGTAGGRPEDPYYYASSWTDADDARSWLVEPEGGGTAVALGLAPGGELLLQQTLPGDDGGVPTVAVLAARAHPGGAPAVRRISPRHPAASGAAVEVAAALSDGRVLYRVVPEDEPVLRVTHVDGRHADGSLTVPLPAGTATIEVAPVGPRDEVVALVILEAADAALWTLSPDGEPARRLSPAGSHPELPIAWSRDGTWVVSPEGSGPWPSVVATPVGGGEAVPYRLLDVPGWDVRFVTWASPR